MHKEHQKESEIDKIFIKYFINKIEEERINKSTQSSLNEEDSIGITSNDCFFNPLEESSFKNKNISKIFEVIYPKKDSVFTRIENDSIHKEEKFEQRKRYPNKRRRRENQDNIRKKIKRGFLNNGLIKKINEILKNNGIGFFFEKFQQNFVCDVTRRTNNALMNMTLEEIFEKKELYKEAELKYYYHNLNLVKSKIIQENIEIKNILNKKLYLIFEEFVNSKEFLIDEINRLKNKNMDNEYIERYKYLTKHFIEFAMD